MNRKKKFQELITSMEITIDKHKKEQISKQLEEIFRYASFDDKKLTELCKMLAGDTYIVQATNELAYKAFGENNLVCAQHDTDLLNKVDKKTIDMTSSLIWNYALIRLMKLLTNKMIENSGIK